MTWSLWAGFALISAVNIITPGPANLNTMRRALQLGRRCVWPTIFGNALGLALGGLACLLGLAGLLRATPGAWLVFQMLGAGYLAWLGGKLLLRRETLVLNGSCPAGHGLFVEALTLAATNPKALLFYMALFPQILAPDQSLLAQGAVLITTYCGLSICSLNLYAGVAQILRDRALDQRGYDWFRRLSGLVLLGFALHLVL